MSVKMSLSDGHLPSISVVVCTFNGADRLPSALEAISDLVYSGSWEVVVVDNASTDATASVAAMYEARVPSFRLVREPVPGLWNARLAGIRSSQSEIVCFVDDDNLLSADYLEEIAKAFRGRPHLGAVNGRSELYAPGFNVPHWFESVANAYAVGAQRDAPGELRSDETLWGAGLAVRRAALDELFGMGFKPILTGRSGAQMLAGDDAELCLALSLCRWGLVYEPRLRLRHAIDTARIRMAVVERMAHGFGSSWEAIMVYRSALRGGFRGICMRNRALRMIGLVTRLVGASVRLARDRDRVGRRLEVVHYKAAVLAALDGSVLARRVLESEFFSASLRRKVPGSRHASSDSDRD